MRDLPGARILLLTVVLVPAALGAQDSPSCRATIAWSDSAVLRGGRTVTASPQTTARGANELAILGVPTLGWDDSLTGARADAHDRGLVGVRRTDRGVFSLVRAPGGHETAREIRATPAAGGWDVVYFIPDSLDPGSPGKGENGALWYAQLRGARWSGPKRVGLLRPAEIRAEASSPLLRHRGRLHFAVGYGPSDGRGGILLFRRDPDGAWQVDSLRLPYGPLYVTAVQPVRQSDEVEVYFVASLYESGHLYAGSLQATNFARQRTTRVAIPGDEVSLTSPVVIRAGDRLVASWWQPGTRRGDSPSLRTAVLDTSVSSTTATLRTVATGTNEYVALPVSIDGSPAILWLFRIGLSSHDIGVALLYRGRLLQLPALHVANQGRLAAASEGGNAVNLVTVALPAPGAATWPATVVSRLVVECARARSQHSRSPGGIDDLR